MAFYDFSSDQEVGFPIILEPDDDGSLFEMRVDDTRMNNDKMKEVHQVKEVKKAEEINKNNMVPKHPIISMQGAFAESMEEASDTTRTAPKTGDAATRRQILIEQGLDEDTHSLRWQRKPGQKYHELWKLMAQISFGIYLLLNGIARDEEQVMSILQGHVNEVDGFLEMTLEDFDLAQTDIEERLKHLKLPLQNIDIFDAMLEDEAFRSQIVSGNERIEHVITRTAAAMKDTLLDAQQGMDASTSATLPTFSLVQGRERAPEPESESESEHESEPEQEPEPEPDSETEPETLYTLKPITYSPILLPTTYSPLLAPKTYSPALAPATDSPTLAPKTYSPLLLPTTYTPTPSPKPSPKPSPRTSPKSSPTKEAPQETLKPPSNLLSTPRITPVAGSVVDSYLKPNQTIRPRDRSEQRRIEPLDLSADRAKRTREKEIREERSRERLRDDYSKEERSKEPKRDERQKRDERSTDHNIEERNRERKGSGPLSIPRHPELATNTPPSRGVDSAYCSESDPPIAIRSIQETLPSPLFSISFLGNISTEISFLLLIPIKQFFRPVNASPHSPLQRPWTAAPVHHHERVPSSLGRSIAPSRMGMSVMSDTTTVTLEDGKKVKKKRSAFGWLRKHSV
ncbi:hypothetical protein DID88_008950 [Monilinia fructigena]|uniref:Uncharacterized protein n=1 Tax=Monilinia fructigena TaxID=38457 RepID=A0A395JBY1_9HELO|nr:hypothetical protein DID88_008950 [Monilinia fructigena]